MPQLLFGGILAVIMLGLYGYSIYEAVKLAKICGDVANCQTPLPSNISLLFNVIGGLISATVVGVLGSTNRGEFPAQKSFEKDLSGISATIAGYMPSVFILFWIICGLYMLVFGFLTFTNDPVPPLTAQAKAWVGTAIGAVYAYIGINPDGKPVERPAIAKLAIAPATVNLTAATPTATLSATAMDAQNNTIPNLPNNRFQWTSDDPAVATVDETGLVTRISPGNCNVTATANNNTVISNNCVVTCG
jgi:hypothetical protein